MKKTLLSLATVTAVTGIATTTADASEYKIKAGDTLWSIAMQYNTSVSEIQSLNNISSHLIFPNQVIKVGEEKVEASTSTGSKSNEATQQTSEAPVNTNASTYTIKYGDTLYKIGQKFNVDYKKIKEWNNLSSDMIYAGKTLVVKAPAQAEATTQTRTVEAVETEEVKPAETNTVKEDNNQAAEAARKAEAERQAEAARKAQAEAARKAQVQQTSSSVSNGSVESIAARIASGKRYVFGANNQYAVDCSAFTQQFMKAYKGINIPRTARGQQAAGTKVSNPQAGDLVVFNNGSHIGVYLGNGMVYDALNPTDGIGKRSVSWIWGHVDGYYRF